MDDWRCFILGVAMDNDECHPVVITIPGAMQGTRVTVLTTLRDGVYAGNFAGTYEDAQGNTRTVNAKALHYLTLVVE